MEARVWEVRKDGNESQGQPLTAFRKGASNSHGLSMLTYLPILSTLHSIASRAGTVWPNHLASLPMLSSLLLDQRREALSKSPGDSDGMYSYFPDIPFILTLSWTRTWDRHLLE